MTPYILNTHMRLLNQTSGRLSAPRAGSCPPLRTRALRAGRPGPMRERASGCRDNPKHTCTQREGPTVREDHLHLWLDKERCRSTRWNALLPFRRTHQSMYMVCKHPALIIIHDAPFRGSFKLTVPYLEHIAHVTVCADLKTEAHEQLLHNFSLLEISEILCCK